MTLECDLAATALAELAVKEGAEVPVVLTAGGAARVRRRRRPDDGHRPRGDIAAIPDRVVRQRLDAERVVRYVLLALFGLFLWVFLAWPMAQMLWRSLLDNTAASSVSPTTCATSPRRRSALSIVNSLTVSLIAMVLTVGLAFVYAYALTRTRMPGRGAFRLVAMLPIFAPSLVSAIAFVYAFGNNGLFTRQTGINVGIYGAKGIVLAEVFYCFPHAMLILMAAFAAADARLYDAAAALGAPRRKIFLTVTLPGVKYGLMSACFVVFTLVLTDFGVPKVVGGKFSVMATEIYNQVIGQQNFTMGATVSVVLLVPALLACVVDRLVQRRQYALVSSSARPLTPGGTGLARGLLFAYCALIAACILAIYFVIFAVVGGHPVAVQPHADAQALPLRQPRRVHGAAEQRVGGGPDGGGRHRHHLRRRVPGGEVPHRGQRRALPVRAAPGGGAGDGAGSGLHLCVQRPRQRPQSRLRHAGHPGHLQPHSLLHGALPDRDDHAQADGRRVRDVSASMGVAFYRTFWRVTVPIALPSIVGVSMYFFLNAMVTLSAVVFLVAPGTELAAVAVLLLDDAGETAQATGMSVLIIGIGLLARLTYWALLRGVTRRTQAWTTATREPGRGA